MHSTLHILERVYYLEDKITIASFIFSMWDLKHFLLTPLPNFYFILFFDRGKSIASSFFQYGTCKTLKKKNLLIHFFNIGIAYSLIIYVGPILKP
jgi:hypothetical protein